MSFSVFRGHIFALNSYEIIRPKPAPIHVDGEKLEGEEILNISVIPGGLKVILPEGI